MITLSHVLSLFANVVRLHREFECKNRQFVGEFARRYVEVEKGVSAVHRQPVCSLPMNTEVAGEPLDRFRELAAWVREHGVLQVPPTPAPENA